MLQVLQWFAGDQRILKYARRGYGPVRAGPFLLLLALATLGPAASGASLSDPRDAGGGPADLRTVAWNVRDADADVVLETWARPDTTSWDYVAALLLGNASRAEPAESYYLAKSLAGGSIAVARHADRTVEARLTVEGERLRFAFPRVLPEAANLTLVNCTFAVGGTGLFGNGTQAADSAPDGGDAGASDPWRLRATLCAPPPPPARAPGPGVLGVTAALGLALALAARDRRG